VQIPPISYLPTEDGHIGWQSWGDGEPVILDTGMSFFASIEDVPDQPRLLRWVTGLAGIGRLLRYDPPGVGISDAAAEPPSFSQWADAGVRVLDAAGVDRAALIAVGSTTGAALRIYERHPDRVASLVVINGAARILAAPDYPEGLDPAIADFITKAATSPETANSSDDTDLLLLAPSVAQDPDFRSWFGRVARRNAHPRIAGPLNIEIFTSDLRYLLPNIAVPTLVLTRRDIAVGTGGGRRLAELIPDARYVELPGNDIVPFLGDVDALLAEIRGHLTGQRHAAKTERVFATVMFTDLVGSTEELARRGDGEWRALLADHLAMVGNEVARHGGRLVKDLGDGTLCTFRRRVPRSAAASHWSTGQPPSSAYRCGPVSTPGRSSCRATTSRASTSTSPPGSPPSHSRGRCWSPRPWSTWSPAHGSPSRTAACTS
jgi:pimeloyl-ACP methyl ester carboxylesterase